MAKKNTSQNNVSSEETVQNKANEITEEERVKKIVSSLKNLLENGEDWERKSTSVDGVSVIKLPASKTKNASLAIEINPVDSRGFPMKKKGVMIMSTSEVDAFLSVFSDNRVNPLINIMHDVSGIKKGSTHKDADIIEI